MSNQNAQSTDGGVPSTAGTCSRPRRRFKIEVVGYGDSYMDAMEQIEAQLEDAYASPVEDCRIGGVGWIKVDEKPDAPTGDDYLKAVREYRKLSANA